MDKYADRVESISIAMDIGGMDMGLGELVFDDITKYIKPSSFTVSIVKLPPPGI